MKQTLHTRQAITKLSFRFMYEVYVLTLWLLILGGGMLIIGSLFIGQGDTRLLLESWSIGCFTCLFGLSFVHLLQKEKLQTTPLLWF